MHIEWSIVATIVAPLLALVLGAFLDRWFEKRPKVITFYGHVSTFTITEPEKFNVFAHSVVVRNTGRESAHNLRIGHNILPNFQVQPATNYSINELPDGSKEIVIPILRSGEEIHVSYLYFPNITYSQVNTYVKCDEGLAQVLKVLLSPVYPKWMTNVVRIVFFIGATTILYLATTFVTWLMR